MEKVNDIGDLFFFVRVTLLLSVTSSISRYIFFQRRLFSLRIHPGDKRASGGLMTAEPNPGGFEQTLIDEVYKQQLVEGV